MIGRKVAEKITAVVNAEADSLLHLVQQLVQIPSVPGKEKECALFCYDKMTEMGLETDIWTPNIDELRDHPAFTPTESDYTDSPNVVGVWKGTGGGRSILLNGHLDVVPPGPLDLWQDSPWSGRIEDGRLYGRGSLDMKAGLAIMIKAVEILQSLGLRLKGDVTLEFVIDEELGGNGTLAAILRGYRAESGIILEPWGVGNIVIGHRGALCFRVTVEGESASSLAARGKGANAITNMATVIDAVRAVGMTRKKLTIADPVSAAHAGPLSFYIGSIQGGYWACAMPLRCHIDGLMGWLEEETLEGAKRYLSWVILTELAKDERYQGSPPSITFPAHRILPWRTDPDHPLVKLAVKAMEMVTHQKAKVGSGNSGSDQWLLGHFADMPTVQFGPSGTNAHAPNEYVNIEDVLTCAKILLLSLIGWCGVQE